MTNNLKALTKDDSLNNWLSAIENNYSSWMDLGLERVAAVFANLNLNLKKKIVITFAGTNGKGSTLTYTEGQLLANGYKVGSYTSPHLWRFNERIRINGVCVDDATLTNAFSVIAQASKEIKLSFFEFTTLAAFYIFQNQNLDFLLLEIGLGGRLDAVNIIDSDIAVITTIGLDHTDWLGDTIDKIAYEKAGILRAKQYAIIGLNQIPNSMQQVIDTLEVKSYELDKDFTYYQNNEGIVYKSSYQQISVDKINLPAHSFALSCAILESIKVNFNFAVKIFTKVIEKQTMPARMQILHDKILQIFDVAHNLDSILYLKNTIENYPVPGKTLAVVGMLKDKDHKSALKPMLDIVDNWYLVTLNGARGYSSEALASDIKEIATNLININCLACPLDGIKSALSEAKSGDRIIVFGSFHTVAEILPRN